MRFLQRGGQALLGELRLLLVHAADWRLALLLAIFAVLLLLAAQAPLRYAIDVGQADGPGSDLPLVAGFFPPEQDVHGDFRWTTSQATIRLPGVGVRPLLLTLAVFPISQEVAQRGPREIELWANDRLVAKLPVRPAGAIYRVGAPPSRSGDLAIELRSATFVPAGDVRSIGAPVDFVRVEAAGPALPAWRGTLAWLGAAALLWLALRRAGFASASTLTLLLPLALLAALAALLDPPRFAFGSGAYGVNGGGAHGGGVLQAVGLGWLLVLALNADAAALMLAGGALWLVGGLVGLGAHGGSAPQGLLAGVGAALLLAGWVRPALGALYRRHAAPIGPRAWRWLLLIALVVFTTRYGGKIYPESMPGDIGFHDNRYVDAVRGMVLLLSRNRGVDFPYPPAFYLLLAPLSLLGLHQRTLLQLVGALLDALSPFLVYAIAMSASVGKRDSGDEDELPILVPLIAAGIYSLSASGLMTTWWNFSTHIFTQFAHLTLITALVLLWRPQRSNVQTFERSNVELAGVLFVLQLLVYLGHFGFWINMSLLGAGGLAALLLAAPRGRAAWRRVRPLLLGFIAAELFAGLFFYSAFTGLFLAQAQAAAAGGLTGLAGRGAVDRTILWQTLWDAGFRVHFGFFPSPLALVGLLLLYRRTKNGHPKGQPRTAQRVLARTVLGSRSSVLVLMIGTFAIGLCFAVLPFLSGSTLSTRWLMFSAWAIAVAGAMGARAFWRSGRAGRLLVLMMGCYMVWVTASMWLAALAWRVRPPEPF